MACKVKIFGRLLQSPLNVNQLVAVSTIYLSGMEISNEKFQDLMHIVLAVINIGFSHLSFVKEYINCFVKFLLPIYRTSQEEFSLIVVIYDKEFRSIDILSEV